MAYEKEWLSFKIQYQMQYVSSVCAGNEKIMVRNYFSKYTVQTHYWEYQTENSERKFHKFYDAKVSIFVPH